MIWNDFRFRDDDIVIATYGKSGHDLDAADRRPAASSTASRGPAGRGAVAVARPAGAAEGGEAAGGRGADAPPLPQDASAGRCARRSPSRPSTSIIAPRRPRRDVEHVQPPRQRQRSCGTRRSTTRRAGSVRRSSGRPLTSRTISLDWLAEDGDAVLAVLGEYARSWWAIRDLPNVHVVHISDSEARTCPARCGGSPSSSTSRSTRRRWPAIVEHCCFDWMKANATRASRSAARSGRRGADLHQQGHQRPLARHADGAAVPGLRGAGAGRAGTGMRGVAQDRRARLSGAGGRRRVGAGGRAFA